MTTIQVDDQIAATLQQESQRAGMSVQEYLRSLLPAASTFPRPTWEEVEHEIEAVSFSGQGLPQDFSRADMYDDHD
jgi:hypothetical protein